MIRRFFLITHCSESAAIGELHRLKRSLDRRIRHTCKVRISATTMADKLINNWAADPTASPNVPHT
jgi:hypothetical protein